MIPYARLQPGPGFQPAQAALYYLQRMVSWPSPRRTIARFLAAAVNLGQREARVAPAEPLVTRALEALREVGVAHLPPLASAPQIQQMYDYFAAQPVLAPDGRRFALSDLPAGAPSAAYDLKTVVACPGLMEIVNSPEVLRIVSAYIGCKPTLSSLGVRWSFPSAHGVAGYQNFHRDIDDWRFLKLFVYLTDVDEGSGPHSYVHGSHRQGFAWRASVYTHSEVEAEFGRDRIETVTGPRGATFMADTVGVHRGGVVTHKPRLILQAQYSILPVFAFRYAAPVPVAAAAFDVYVNRLLIEPMGGHVAF